MPAASAPAEVVRTFLDRLSAGEYDDAMTLVDEEIRWINTGLPTIKGKKATSRAFASMTARGMGIELRIHHLAADGDTVLTDRTDVLVLGSVETAFWVRGTFEVHDGKITVWDDRYSPVDLLTGAATGVFNAMRGMLGR